MLDPVLFNGMDPSQPSGGGRRSTGGMPAGEENNSSLCIFTMTVRLEVPLWVPIRPIRQKETRA